MNGMRGVLLAVAAVACMLVGASRAEGAQFLTDPSFAGTNASTLANPFWTGTDSRPGGRNTPICNSLCGVGYPKRHDGDEFLWFGGWGSGSGSGIEQHTETIQQTVQTPAVTGAVLGFYLYPEAYAMQPAALVVKFDGVTVFTLDGTNQAALRAQAVAANAYLPMTFPVGDLTAGPHTVRFEYEGTHNPNPTGNPGCLSGGVCPTNWWVDEITLTGTPVGVPPAPTLTATNPTSEQGAGANNLHPKIIGSAQAGTTVKLYGNATCTGDVLGTGPGGAMANPGIEATVAHNTTTTFYATAENENGVSPCSPTSVTYYEFSVPSAPLINGFPPAGLNNNHPMIKGAAAPNSTVKVYKGGSCTIEANLVATGTSDDLQGAGIPVHVLNNTTTTFRAQVTNDGGTSPCSSQVTYKEVTPKPSMPAFFKSTPASPATSNTPRLHGDFTDNSAWEDAPGSVRIYTTSDCTGSVAGSGTAEQFVDPGIAVTVADGTTTSFYANLEQPLTNEKWAGVSPCTAVPIVYTDSSTPTTPPPPPGPDPFVPPVITPPDNFALLASALKKCKKKKGKKAEKKCKKKAKQQYS